jgi:hypothetical protein
MNIDQAKSIRIDDFLENLGYICDKKTAGRKWFRFRDEKTASFVVSKDGGAFFDHGTGEYGNIIDVAKKEANTDSVSEALKFIESKVGSEYTFTVRQTLPVQPTEPYYSIAYDAEFSIYKGRYLSQAAIYLKDRRGILPEAFYPYLRDIFHVSKPDQKKPFYGFGLPNVAGGFECRTYFQGRWHKRSVGPKDVTAFYADREHAPWHCFYSMMDFGTFLTVDNPPIGVYNYLIINGDGLVGHSETPDRPEVFGAAERYLETVEPGHMIHYPHTDLSGQRAYQRMLDFTVGKGWAGGDRAHLYDGFKDWTEKRERELGLDRVASPGPGKILVASSKFRP